LEENTLQQNRGRVKDPGVLEIVEDPRGDTYRAVYTVRLAKAIYVLQAFQKKSTRGIATSRRDVDLIRRRLRGAQEDYEVCCAKND